MIVPSEELTAPTARMKIMNKREKFTLICMCIGILSAAFIEPAKLAMIISGIAISIGWGITISRDIVKATRKTKYYD